MFGPYHCPYQIWHWSVSHQIRYWAALFALVMMLVRFVPQPSSSHAPRCTPPLLDVDIYIFVGPRTIFEEFIAVERVETSAFRGRGRTGLRFSALTFPACFSTAFRWVSRSRCRSRSLGSFELSLRQMPGM